MDFENDDHTFEDKSATGDSASDKSHGKSVGGKHRGNSADDATDAVVIALDDDDDELSGEICKQSVNNSDKRNSKYKGHDEEKPTVSDRATSADNSNDWQTEGRPSTKRQK